MAKTGKSIKQRGGARLPVASGDEVADLLDAGEPPLHFYLLADGSGRWQSPTGVSGLRGLSEHTEPCRRRRSPADAQRRQPGPV